MVLASQQAPVKFAASAAAVPFDLTTQQAYGNVTTGKPAVLSTEICWVLSSYGACQGQQVIPNQTDSNEHMLTCVLRCCNRACEMQ
jgi:hypothetical protein